MAFRPPFLGLLALVLCCCAQGVAETPDQIVNPKRAANTWVSDGARVLDAATERRLNALSDRLERQTTAELAVVTVRRTDGRTPKQFATLLFNRWGVGKRSKNNGVLMLVVLDVRRIEVETGRGMARALPDSRVQRILAERVIPRFKQSDYNGGILAGAEALAQNIAHPGGASASAPPSSAPVPRPVQHTLLSPGGASAPPTPMPQPVYPTAPLPGGSVTFVHGVPQGNAAPWGTIAVGALLLGGGIGVYRMSRVRRCPRCGQPMRRLGEIEDDALLAVDQRFEEGLGSVDYRVWRCDRCQTSHSERAVKWLSGYNDCPGCRHRTLQEHTDVLRHPSYDWEGEALVTRTCRFPGCGFLDRQMRILPRQTRPSASSSPSGSSSSDSSSSSSSSSSDSSSSSGSFGGGSSDGGGAGASW